MKNYYRGNIEQITLNNEYYRKVIFTTKNMQLVLMSLRPGREIGTEVHPRTSQFIRIEKGHATVYIRGRRHKLKDGDAMIIPPGYRHNIINTGHRKLKLYTIYTPPEHPRNTKER